MLFIPRPETSHIGGPSTFMRNLWDFINSIDFNIANDLSEASTLFFPIEYDRGEVIRHKESGGRVIQRLDGIYYPSKHGDMHSKLNENIEFIYNNLTNHVIFQSAYSRSQCFEMLGVISTDKYSIIYNGVDKSIFQPATNPVGKKTRLMSTGNFRNLDMLEPLVLSLDSLVKDYDFELILIGPVINDELKPLLNRKYISYQGLQEREQLAKSLQQADIFLYSHLNPPCPNSVLEAISTGLPIVGFDSGSMRELCFFNTELLVPVSDRVFQQYDEFNADLLANVISNCIDNYSYYKEQALKNSNLFDFQDCGQAYVNVFKNQISRD